MFQLRKKKLYQQINMKKQVIGQVPEKFLSESVDICKLDCLREQVQENLQVIARIREWEVQKLNLSWNYRASLIEEIAHIRFNRLLVLDLAGNYFSSLESMELIFMPVLEILSLNESYIWSVRTLRKAHWPELYSLELSFNFIGDYYTLVQGFLPELETLQVDNHLCVEHLDWKAKEPYNPCFLSKLQAGSMKNLSLNRQKFAIQRGLASTLQRKWEWLQFIS